MEEIGYENQEYILTTLFGRGGKERTKDYSRTQEMKNRHLHYKSHSGILTIHPIILLKALSIFGNLL